MRRGSRLTATDIKDAGSKLGSTDGSDARGESAPADQRGWVGCGYNGGQWLVWGVEYLAIRSGWRGAAVVVVVSDTESEAGSEGCMNESACLVT